MNVKLAGVLVLACQMAFAGCSDMPETGPGGGESPSSTPRSGNMPSPSNASGTDHTPRQTNPSGSATTFSVETDKPRLNLYASGEVVSLALMASGRPLSVHNASLEVYDSASVSVFRTEIPFALDGTGNAKYILSLPHLKYGFYRVETTVDGTLRTLAKGTRPAGETTFAVVHDGHERGNFGSTGSRFGLQGATNPIIDVFPYLGVRYTLNGATSGWSQPVANGRATLNPALANRDGWETYPVTALLRWSIPPWALKTGTQGLKCPAFGALNDDGARGWQQYTQDVGRETARRDVTSSEHYYQVTWEPHYGGCFRGTDSDFIKFYSLAYAQLHSADSHALIAGPTLDLSDASNEQLEKLLQDGFANDIDVFSFHGYLPEGGKETVWPFDGSDFTSRLRNQIAEVRASAKRPIIFICTEHGYSAAQVGESAQALGNIKAGITIIGEGAKVDFGFILADFWPGLDPKQSAGYGLFYNLDKASAYIPQAVSPKLAGVAYSAMTYFLDGATSQGPLPNLPAGLHGYSFIRGGEKIVVLWSGGSTIAINLSTPRSVCDWMGNCDAAPNGHLVIGESPTYISYGQ